MSNPYNEAEIRNREHETTALAKRVYIVDGSGTAIFDNLTFSIGSQDTLAVSLHQKVATDLQALSTLVHGQKTVTTAGTAVAIGSSTTLRSITIKALPTNTGYIYVGGSGVDSSNGFVLGANESVSLDFDQLADVYIDSDNNGEGVSYIGLNA